MKISSNKQYRNLILFSFLALFLSSLLFIIYIRDFPWTDPRFGLYRMIDGTAHKPFVYRRLMPFLIRIVISVISIRPRIAASALMFMFLIGFFFAIRYLASAFKGLEPYSETVSLSSFFVLALLRFPYPYEQLYDFSTLFLFTLCLALMIRARWSMYMLVYTVGCLNKETFILLVIAFVASYYNKIKNRAYLIILVLQVIVFVAIRAGIMWYYQGNPGGTLEFNLSRHIEAMSKLPGLTVGYLLASMVCLWFAAKNWKSKPKFLRRTISTVSPIFLLLYFLFGSPFEFRVFYELIPIWLLMVFLSFPRKCRVLKWDPISP